MRVGGPARETESGGENQVEKMREGIVGVWRGTVVISLGRNMNLKSFGLYLSTRIFDSSSIII